MLKLPCSYGKFLPCNNSISEKMRFGISGNQCIIDTSSHVEILNGKEIIQNVFQFFFPFGSLVCQKKIEEE
jgi:hypothetical protein